MKFKWLFSSRLPEFYLQTESQVRHHVTVNEAVRSKKFWILTVAALVAIVIVGIWFGRPVYLRFKENRSVKQAHTFLDKQDYRSAALSIRTALAINPNNVEAARLMAELAEAGRSPAALIWRRRVAELDPTLDNKIMVAACALRYENPPFSLAAQTLQEIGETGKTNLLFQLVASQLAIKLNRLDDALSHLEAAAALQPTNRLHQLNLATLRLRALDTNVAAIARRELVELADDAVLGPPALRSLVADGLAREQFGEAQVFSRQLLAQPKATFDDRLQHLTVLQAAKSGEFESAQNQIQQESATNAMKTAALISWLVSHDSATEALRWVKSLPEPARATMPVPLAEADVYLALEDWSGLEIFLSNQRWDEQEYVRFALLSRALREQGRLETSGANWRLAVGAASKRQETVAMLAQIASRWNWQPETEELLWTIAKRFPAAEFALKDLLRAYGARQDSAGLYRVYQALLERHPNSLEFKNNVAMLALLLNRDEPRAIGLAREVYDASNTNALFVSTYAFALHAQGKSGEGLKLMEQMSESELLQPNIAGYYAMLLAATGDKDRAETFFAAAEKSSLLPEERRLLEQARTGN